MQNELTTKIVQKDTFDVVLSAVNKMVDLIKPTFGPAGNKVIISKQTHALVVDDGVQIARDFELPDPAENAIVKLVRESAVRTNDRVGDGTTGSLIILQAIMNAISRLPHRDSRQIILELKEGLKEAIEYLQKISLKIATKKELKKVAMIAFDDESSAEMIAELYDKLGVDAAITIDKSPTMETTYEIAEGLTINHGYISPYMVTNPERMEAVIDNPLILLTDYRLTEARDVLPILEKIAAAGKHNLVLVAENVEGLALATLVRNLPTILNTATGKTGVIQSVAIVGPTGADKKTFLNDIGLLTGAKVFSQSKGDKLELAELSDLGRAEKLISRREESIIISPAGDKTNIATAITDLRMSIDAEPIERAKNELKTRLARFENKVAVIKVGAVTENEQKTLKYKIEDAVNAVRSALHGGVVPGGGEALASAPVTSEILKYALSAPRTQLFANVGAFQTHPPLNNGEAYNVITGKQGNMMEVGVVDPTDALIAALESAVSISTLLLSYGIIVEYPQENKK